jgi:hypothetical protein
MQRVTMKPLTNAALQWSRLPVRRQVPPIKLGAGDVLVKYSDPAMREPWQRVESRCPRRAARRRSDDLDLAAEAPLAVCVCAFEVDRGHFGRHRPS